jgi:fermentation-respiration switch protein FrsA (DUF1100 family)
MGAVAAIHAAANDRRIQAVIAVSPFVTLREVVDQRLAGFRSLTSLLIWWVERLTGLHLDDVRPAEVVASLSPRPILIMEAGNDGLVPPGSGQRLYQAAIEPKELWSVPGADHVDFRQAVPEQYRQRVLDFFKRHLVANE